MKAIGSKILAVVLTLIFVNFVFSNTVYTHSHIDANGKLITHSHPYLPSSGHSHSQTGLDQVANFNFSSGAFVASAALEVCHYSKAVSAVWSECRQHTAKHFLNVTSLRAPPAEIS